jgi:hypothetical protein
MLRYLLAWIPMLIIAVANGALRQASYGRAMPELRAHQLSTLIGMILIGAFIWLVVRRWPPSSGAQGFRIGLVWVALTVAFEFFMTVVLMGRPVAAALADYDLLAGRLWVLFLAWLAVAPWLFVRLRSR